MIKKTCKYEGCESTKIWSGGFCRQHTSYKPLEKSNKPIKKISEKGKIKKEERKTWLNELHEWEMELWDKLEDKNGYVYCYETGTPMHRDKYKSNLSIYSHCYPKSTYKEIAMEEWNLLLVLPEIHELWGQDSSKTPKMKQYFETVCKEEFDKFYNKS